MTRQSRYGRAGALALVGGAFAIALAAAPASAVCVGDCDGNGMVGINELVIGVNIALGLRPVSDCPEFACTGGDTVPINCLVQGVNNALGTCPAEGTPTATPAGTATATVTVPVAATATATVAVTVGEDTPTPTPTVGAESTPTATVGVAECPLAAGRYTITQLEGGKLQVASIAGDDGTGFPFPPGGTVIQDVGTGDANCVHETVVPAAGGFSAPVFCIPGLNFTVQVVQSACGVGQIDSNGGSDYTVTEIGDTSDSSDTCDLPAVGCPPGPPSAAERDGSLRVDITVGNDTADTCPGGGTANAIVAIPVRTTTWLAADFSICPDADGMFNPPADTLVLEIPQILDFTTDVTTARWSDIDSDGCSIAGAGPPGGLTRTGICIDTTAMTVTTAAAGTIGSAGSPLFDLTFATLLPNALSGPIASGGATCDPRPVINFTGDATRCIE